VNFSSALDLLALLYGLLLAAAAVQDVLTLRISNLLSVAVLAVAGVALVVDPGPVWWQHLLSFGLVFGLGILLFSLGWVGGGDAKLLAGAALAFDLMGLVRFLPTVLIVGGLLALVAILLRTVAPRLARRGSAIPYGVAVAIGAAVAILLFPESSAFAN
jgi:prepilin peptidase CpaA